MTLILKAVRADTLAKGDVLATSPSRFVPLGIIEVFNTGHGRIQVTAASNHKGEDHVLWLDDDDLVIVVVEAV